MMISHEAVNKIESLKRGAFGILPVLCQMCIRDSLSEAQTMNNDTSALSPKEQQIAAISAHTARGDMPGLRNALTAGPVSYTHLDVYKRQVESQIISYRFKENEKISFYQLIDFDHIVPAISPNEAGRFSSCLLYTSGMGQRSFFKESGEGCFSRAGACCLIFLEKRY